MRVHHDTEVAGREEVPGVVIRPVIGPQHGAPHFTMRVFDIQRETGTPLHSHDWEHEVYILSGWGYVEGKDGKRDLQPGDVVFIAPEEEHHFVNTGGEPFRFICVIPNQQPVVLQPVTVSDIEWSPPVC